jgi:hypothetical protein
MGSNAINHLLMPFASLASTEQNGYQQQKKSLELHMLVRFEGFFIPRIVMHPIE